MGSNSRSEVASKHIRECKKIVAKSSREKLEWRGKNY